MVNPTPTVPNQRNAYTVTLSTFLLVEGVWGLFSPVVFGYLTTNLLHAIIHIVLGITGIVCVFTERARGFLVFIGLLLLAVGGAWFVPALTVLITSTFNLNSAVAWLNVVVGAVSLGMAAKRTSS